MLHETIARAASMRRRQAGLLGRCMAGMAAGLLLHAPTASCCWPIAVQPIWWRQNIGKTGR